MITADEVRKMTYLYRAREVNKELKKINKQIKKDIKQGNFYSFYKINFKETINTLQRKRFIVTKNYENTFYKISWESGYGNLEDEID